VQPSERALRNALHREAARVPIPQDMWENISSRLDEDAVPAVHRRTLSGKEQWRPALALAVAAGFFWFALIPSLANVERVMPAESGLPPIIVPVGQSNDPLNTPTQAMTDTAVKHAKPKPKTQDTVQLIYPGPLKPN